MDQNIKEVLDSIFNSNTGYSPVDRGALELSPSYSEVVNFAELLSQNTTEEETQKFIQNNPKFITSLEGFGDSQVLAFIPKPRIGTKYIADYCILGFSQGGCFVNLIELEPTDADIFTKKLSPAKRYQGAITQITDWKQWIKLNQSTYINDLIDKAVSLDQYSANTNTGFRTRDPETIRDTWEKFDGFMSPHFVYTIVIGRWSKLNNKEHSRLISLNQSNWYKTYTYEQMIRRGIERPFGGW